MNDFDPQYDWDRDGTYPQGCLLLCALSAIVTIAALIAAWKHGQTVGWW
jgi:hypothetical protein